MPIIDDPDIKPFPDDDELELEDLPIIPESNPDDEPTELDKIGY